MESDKYNKAGPKLFVRYIVKHKHKTRSLTPSHHEPIEISHPERSVLRDTHTPSRRPPPPTHRQAGHDSGGGTQVRCQAASAEAIVPGQCGSEINAQRRTSLDWFTRTASTRRERRRGGEREWEGGKGGVKANREKGKELKVGGGRTVMKEMAK